MRKIETLANALILTLLLTACQTRPDYVIDEERMTDLLTDVHMAEGLIDVQQRHNRDDVDYGQQVMAAVLMKHDVSKADYDTSLVWYSQHLTTLNRIYRHVNDNLKDREQEWMALADEADDFGLSPAGDSVSLWRQPPYLVMDEAHLTHFRTWTLATDSNFHKGDTVRWLLHVGHVPEGEAVIASLALLQRESRQSGWIVADGTSSARLTSDTSVTLTCIGPENEEITQVNATLHLMKIAPSAKKLMPCVVDSLDLVRIHRKNEP